MEENMNEILVTKKVPSGNHTELTKEVCQKLHAYKNGSFHSIHRKI